MVTEKVNGYYRDYATHRQAIAEEFKKPVSDRDWQAIRFHQRGLAIARSQCEQEGHQLRLKHLKEVLKGVKSWSHRS